MVRLEEMHEDPSKHPPAGWKMGFHKCPDDLR